MDLADILLGVSRRERSRIEVHGRHQPRRRDFTAAVLSQDKEHARSTRVATTGAAGLLPAEGPGQLTDL